MTDQEKNTESSAPQRPMELGGQVYLISPATPSTAASVFSAVRKRAATDTPLGRLVNDPAFKLLPAQAQVEAAREAAKVQVNGTSFMDGMEVMDTMMLPDVLAFAVWLHARANHPDLKLEDIKPHITSENAAAVFVDFNEASGMSNLGPNLAGRNS